MSSTGAALGAGGCDDGISVAGGLLGSGVGLGVAGGVVGCSSIAWAPYGSRINRLRLFVTYNCIVS